jgi:peroxiredoxin
MIMIDAPRKVRTRRRRIALLLLLAPIAIVAALVLRSGRRTPPPHPPRPEGAIGRRMADFKLPDASGKVVSLEGFRGRVVVLVFTGIDCPIGNLYASRLSELSRKYRDKGVAFLGINSNAHETLEQVAEHAQRHGVEFPVLKDPRNAVADLAGAERTCEALVLDRGARLRYRGAIDDQYSLKAHKDAPTREYLAEALDAVLAGRDVAEPIRPVFGCPIERTEPRSAAINGPRVGPVAAQIRDARRASEDAEAVEVGEVTYAGEVARILQDRCQSCHRPGQVGPFPLLTYDHARRWAVSIREVVEDYRMPPWHADPRHGHFENDRSLTPRERATLIAWVDQGAPLGDPEAIPPSKVFPEGWSIGKPDLILAMAEPYEVQADGTVPYRHFRVKTNFAEDRWIRAAEARPGDRAVVHHIGVYVDEPDTGSWSTGRHTKPLLAAYFPGEQPSVFPAGIAKKIPAGADLVFEMHYTPIGEARADRSTIALIFAKGPVEHRAVTRGIPDKDLSIPPGAPNYAVRSSFTFPGDAHLLGLMPHMHVRGKDFLYTAVYPDGRSEILLSVPSYDFSWQSAYRLAEPKRIPKGTRIDCLAHFDNSPDNPANPDPSQTVTWGEQSWEEMMIGYIDYYEDGPALLAKGAKKSGERSR